VDVQDRPYGEADQVKNMVRETANDASKEKVISDIAKFGWHCVNI
jgi:hypothetical protein